MEINWKIYNKPIDDKRNDRKKKHSQKNLKIKTLKYAK